MVSYVNDEIWGEITNTKFFQKPYENMYYYRSFLKYIHIYIYKRNLNGVTIMYNGDNSSIRYFVSKPGMGYPL